MFNAFLNEREAFKVPVAQTLPFLYAPQEPGQHLSHRAPSVAGWGLSGTGTPACALCMECISPKHRQECLCHVMANLDLGQRRNRSLGTPAGGSANLNSVFRSVRENRRGRQGKAASRERGWR